MPDLFAPAYVGGWLAAEYNAVWRKVTENPDLWLPDGQDTTGIGHRIAVCAKLCD